MWEIALAVTLTGGAIVSMISYMVERRRRQREVQLTEWEVFPRRRPPRYRKAPTGDGGYRVQSS